MTENSSDESEKSFFDLQNNPCEKEIDMKLMRKVNQIFPFESSNSNTDFYKLIINNLASKEIKNAYIQLSDKMKSDDIYNIITRLSVAKIQSNIHYPQIFIIGKCDEECDHIYQIFNKSKLKDSITYFNMFEVKGSTCPQIILSTPFAWLEYLSELKEKLNYLKYVIFINLNNLHNDVQILSSLSDIVQEHFSNCGHIGFGYNDELPGFGNFAEGESYHYCSIKSLSKFQRKQKIAGLVIKKTNIKNI